MTAPPPVNRMTRVKTLPSRNFVCSGEGGLIKLWMLWTISGRYRVPADFGLQCILKAGWFIDMQLFEIILYLCGIYCIIKMRNGRLFMSGDSFLKLYSMGSFHAIWNLEKLQCDKNAVSIAKDKFSRAAKRTKQPVCQFQNKNSFQQRET